MQKGKFVTFEGGEGSGKSTQSRMLVEYLQQQGVDTVWTREPGGTDEAEAIRKLLVNGESDRWDATTELLLHTAARRHHVENLIKPALSAGKFVVCDRFIDSTFAYQGSANALGDDIVRQIQKLAIGDFVPDITFVFDISVEEGIKRAQDRGTFENRYEKMGLKFHKKVREGFLRCAENNPHRCKIIDATGSIESIHKKIIAEIL